MARDPETAYLDSGGYSATPVGTVIAAFLDGNFYAGIPLNAELFLCDPNTGIIQRRITGGDNLDSLINPTF